MAALQTVSNSATAANVNPISTDGTTVQGNGSPGSPLAVILLSIVTAYIGNLAVTLAKMAAGTANRLIGYNGSGTAAEIIIGSGLSLSSGTLSATGGSGAASHDALTSGTVTAQVARIGGTAVVISTPASGEYNLTVSASSHLLSASIFGNNTTLNGSNEFIIRINNVANSRDRRVSVQIYDMNNGAQADVVAFGIVPNQPVVSGNVTVITLSGMNNFTPVAGFRIELS